MHRAEALAVNPYCSRLRSTQPYEMGKLMIKILGSVIIIAVLGICIHDM